MGAGPSYQREDCHGYHCQRPCDPCQAPLAQNHGNTSGYGSFPDPSANQQPGFPPGNPSVFQGNYQPYVIPGQQPPQQPFVLPEPAYGYPILGHQEGHGRWHTGLCDCAEDVPSCCLGCFCPCIAFGENVEFLDDGETSGAAAALIWYLLQQVSYCACVYSCFYRRKLRRRFNLPESPCPDCCVHYLCWPCAICQEAREIKYQQAHWSGQYSAIAPPPPQVFEGRRWD